MRELEQSILEDYKNQFWTRLIQLENFVPDSHERHEMGPDMVAEQ